MSEVLMTTIGRKQLEDELHFLVRTEREQIKQAISEARALGDLKENAEYAAAKERQSIIEGRILDVQSKLARSRVIDTANMKTTKIVFGATVQIYDNQKEVSLTYQIVGEDEAMTDSKKISYTSPLGKTLIGKEVGEEVVVKAPKGDLTYEVQDIKYI
ncbi:MAG: transcription elongation factor GreA [Bacteriovoracaceae bacterium]